MVYTLAIGQFSHSLVPIWCQLVIDALVGTQFYGSCQFFVAAGGNDDPRPNQLGKLEGEQRDASLIS